MGLSVAEFWDLTPKELGIHFEADLWRQTQQAQQAVSLAWYVAALSRVKKLPPLRQLLQGQEARPLRGEELKRRRAEHEDIVKRMGNGGR